MPQWTSDPPLATGWYWLKRPCHPPEPVQVAHCPDDPFPVWVRTPGREQAEPLALMPDPTAYLWGGRIDPPPGWHELDRTTLSRPTVS